jgi:hypothetical protein
MFKFSLSTYALMAALAGWGTYAFIDGITDTITLSRSVKHAKEDTKRSEQAVCKASIAAIEKQQNDHAEGTVAAGNKAAADVPPVKAEDRQKRCAASKFCRGNKGELNGS